MECAVRSPCYTCRSRRIQCDQSGTPCAKCQKAGMECFDKRPFRWVQGVAIRGKMQGRSYENENPVSASHPATSRGALVRAKSRSPFSQSAGIKLEADSPGLKINLPFNLQDPVTSELDLVTKYYLNYYNDHVCKLFVVYDSDKNAFRNLIPLGLKDPALLKALLALAARHHANAGQPFDQHEIPASPRLINANRDALIFKDQAMEALSRCLRDGKRSKQDSTVASIFVLIFLDLVESGSEGWKYHLKGVKNLIASTYTQSESQALINQGPGQTMQEIRQFITRHIYFIETLGATFLRPKALPQFPCMDLQDLQSQEIIEHSFVGCPEYFLKALQYLSRERNTIAESETLDSAAVESHKKEITSILELIQTFDCYVWASNIQQSRDPPPQETANLCTLSQAYKLGAIIYGRRILEALTGESTVQDEMVTELLGMVDLLKDDPPTFKCMLWPIVVVGMESRWETQRNFLLACMERFWDQTSCLNVVNAAKSLQEYWKQETPPGEARSQWIFNIGRADRDWLWL